MSENDAAKASRRTILLAGAAIVAAGAAVRSAAAQQKIEKSLVMYQETPNKDGQKCSTCLNFQPPSSCALVAGAINANGWCGAYAPKPT